MKQLGPFISHHGPSRSTALVLYGLGGLLALLGLALLPLSLQVRPQDRPVIWMGSGLLVACAAGLALLWAVIRPKVAFVLHENGIVTRGHATEELHFLDIAEVKRARVGKGSFPLVGFRATRERPWTVIHGSVSRSGELSRRVREAHTAHHLPTALAQLRNGGTLIFPYVPWMSRQASRVALTPEGHFDAKTESLTLDASFLRVQNEAVALNQVASLEISDWTGELSLRDEKGRSLISLDAVSITNADLLISALESCIHRSEGQQPKG